MCHYFYSRASIQAMRTLFILSRYYSSKNVVLSMPKISVDIPQELLDDLMVHVGRDKKFVTQSDAIRAALRKMLDSLDEIDARHGRIRKDKQ